MKYAFDNANLIDGTQDMRVQPGLCVLTDGETITDIVPAGDGDALVCREHARPDAASGADLVAQARVERVQPADGADRCHAAEQLGARKGAHHAVGHRARDGV